jgi:exopolysaccharide biosynthesis polyprenyl glycosylphosphotransferase
MTTDGSRFETLVPGPLADAVALATAQRPRSVSGRHGTALRTLLVAIDLTAAAAAWSAVIWLGGTTYLDRFSKLLATCLAVGGLVVLIGAFSATRRLYRSRICEVRSVEAARLLQVAIVAGFASVVLAHTVRLRLPARWAVLGALLMFVLTSTARTVYAQCLRRRRRVGRLSRPVALIGDNDEGEALYRLTQQHPECGLRVIGVVGAPSWASSTDLDLPRLGTIDDLPNALGPATGAIVAATAFSIEDLNRLVRNLLRADVHVQMSTGLVGISARRLRPLSIVHEGLFYIERCKPTRVQLLAKRMLDIVLSAVLLVLLSPVLLLAAVAIKRDDRRSPVFYRQRRVGRGGYLFTLYKLRTMVPDAASRLDDIRNMNQRNGPLFKLAKDPRVTRVGRSLRQASIDEIPQLVNVLKGDMSLVGPRPALPDEVAEFDPDLRAREDITPGLTGLWQIEARDSPSFNAYRTLDLFYLENWSFLLDLAIIGNTALVVSARAFKTMASRIRRTDDSRTGPLD